MTKDKFTGRYRLGLKSIFVPDSSPFYKKQMSFYSNVIEQDLITHRTALFYSRIQ